MIAFSSSADCLSCVQWLNKAIDQIWEHVDNGMHHTHRLPPGKHNIFIILIKIYVII